MTAVEYIEQQLGSRIADANIRISAPKFYEIINTAKEIEKNQALSQIAVSNAVCDCSLLGNRKQYEINLNECRFCEKQIKQTDR